MRVDLQVSKKTKVRAEEIYYYLRNNGSRVAIWNIILSGLAIILISFNAYIFLYAFFTSAILILLDKNASCKSNNDCPLRTADDKTTEYSTIRIHENNWSNDPSQHNSPGNSYNAIRHW